MKRSLSLLLVCLMLVFSLTACGRRNNEQATTNDQATTDNQATTNNGTANNGTTDNGTNNNETTTNQEDHPVLDDLENAGENVVQGAEDVGRAGVDGVREAGDTLTGNNERSVNRSVNSTTNNGTLK